MIGPLIAALIAGGSTINMRVFDPNDGLVPATPVSGNIDEAGNQLANALSTNFYFLDILPQKFPIDVGAEFCKGVVQFPADDIGDFYGNANGTTAQAFEDVLDLARFSAPTIGETVSETILCATGGNSK